MALPGPHKKSKNPGPWALGPMGPWPHGPMAPGPMGLVFAPMGPGPMGPLFWPAGPGPRDPLYGGVRPYYSLLFPMATNAKKAKPPSATRLPVWGSRVLLAAHQSKIEPACKKHLLWFALAHEVIAAELVAASEYTCTRVGHPHIKGPWAQGPWAQINGPWA